MVLIVQHLERIALLFGSVSGSYCRLRGCQQAMPDGCSIRPVSLSDAKIAQSRAALLSEL